MGADVGRQSRRHALRLSEFNPTTLAGRAAWLNHGATSSPAAPCTNLYDATENGGSVVGHFIISDVPSENAWKVAVADGTGDTQPPTVPQGLTGVQSTTTKVHLTWTASTDNVGVAGYIIPQWQLAGSSATASFTDGGLSGDDLQLFCVRLRRGGNTSTASSPARSPRSTPRAELSQRPLPRAITKLRLSGPSRRTVPAPCRLLHLLRWEAPRRYGCEHFLSTSSGREPV